jgi:hypothetical protein
LREQKHAPSARNTQLFKPTPEKFVTRKFDRAGWALNGLQIALDPHSTAFK